MIFFVFTSLFLFFGVIAVRAKNPRTHLIFAFLSIATFAGACLYVVSTAAPLFTDAN